MFHLNLAEIVQMGFPTPEVPEQVSMSPRDEDVAGIPAVHHSLRKVYTASGDVVLSVDVRHTKDVTAVDAHTEWQFFIGTQGRGDLPGATNRRANIIEED